MSRSTKMDTASPSNAEHNFDTEDDSVEIEAEIGSSDAASAGSASFHGKLNISAFTFAAHTAVQSESSRSPRRITRSLTRETEIVHARSLKRKGSTANGRSSSSPSKRSRTPS